MTNPRRLKVLSACLMALGIYLPGYSAGLAETLTGRGIMEKQRQLHHLEDEQERRVMVMVDAAGRERTRELSGYVMTAGQDQYRLLLRFHSPRDVRNTGLLVWENDTGDADQWLYLPALRRVKRIPTSGKKNRFMGTDFAYEDLRREAFKLQEYELVGSEKLDGHDTYVVEARPKTDAAEDSGYSKRQFWIDKEHFTTRRIEYYDKEGQLWKVQDNRDFVNLVDTAWAPDEVEMRDVQNDTKTIVRIEERKVNQGLSPRLFTEVELRREQ